MAKQKGKKTAVGTRNGDRRNGKAWSKKKLDSKGRPMSGRGKPTGKTIKGKKVVASFIDESPTTIETLSLPAKGGSDMIHAFEQAMLV